MPVELTHDTDLESSGPTAQALRVDATFSSSTNWARANSGLPFPGTITIRGIPRELAEIEVSAQIFERGQPLSRPWSALVRSNQRARVEILPELELDPASMSDIEEQRPAVLHVRVSSGGRELVTADQPMRVLAARQWEIDPQLGDLSLALVGAFVMPNDPAVTRLLADARVLLKERTGSASTEGYQAGPERVDQIVSAVWDAMRKRDIAYSSPPASWGREGAGGGQKIRSPGEVLDGRAGTCLDTSVVLAAALEHVGINSLVWIVVGHAFVTYWRAGREDGRPLSTDQAASQETVGLKNALDAGQLRLLETTAVTGGERSQGFSGDAHDRTRLHYLTGDLGQVIGVADIYACRRRGIVPLPASRVRGDGTVEVVEYRPAEHSGQHFLPPAPAGADRPGVDAAGRVVPARVQRWKNALLDLSLRNKLINFTERGTVQLAIPDGALPHVEDLLNAGKALHLLPSDQVEEVDRARGTRFGADLPQSALHEVLDNGRVFTDVGQSAYLPRFRGLAYKARTIVEETGANNLYLALGSLHWNVAGQPGGPARPVKSPLILLPVTLTPGRRKGDYQVALDESGASTPNYCLIEKLRQEEQLRIPELENPAEDAYGIDLAATLAGVRQAILDRGLDYHVEDSADLAILQFAKFRLWKDLDDSWQTLVQAPLLSHMVERPHHDFPDPAGSAPTADLDELSAGCPIPADASQLDAIAAAASGRSFVLEGPPGTGKSQTITNLLTRAIVDGKRVLFVAEKRAALDVVSARLAAAGQAPFCLDLHDKASRPAAIRDQVRRALDLAVPIDSQGFAADLGDLTTATSALARYAQRLHQPNAAGLSFYTAHTQMLAAGVDVGPLPVAAELVDRLNSSTLLDLRHQMQTLPDVADVAQPRHHHPWGFIRGTPPGTSETLVANARRVDNAVDRILAAGAVRGVLEMAVSVEQLRALARVLRGPGISLRELDEVRTRSWGQAHQAYLGRLSELADHPQPGLDRARPTALNLELDEIHREVAAASSSGFFGRKKRLTAAMAPLTGHLTAEVLPKDALALVDALLVTKVRAEGLAPSPAVLPGLRPIAGWNPWDPSSRQALQAQQDWLATTARAVDPSQTDEFVTRLRELIAADQIVETTAVEAIEDLVGGLDDVFIAAGATASEVAGWAQPDPLVVAWQSTRPGRESSGFGSNPLLRWLALVDALAPLRAAGLHQAADALLDGTIPADEASRALERGLAEASLLERRAATGLDRFDPRAHDKAATRYATSSAAVRRHLTAVLPHTVLEARPFSSDTDRGQIGALRRELNRQRGGLKVRGLLERYGDLITTLMPCVLVSPDSVARFFPVGSQAFDLVVFDEASQVRVADAVGVIGRAKAVVVVGDSKQMPPTSIAETTLDDSEGGEFSTPDGPADPLDEESILSEAGQVGLRKLELTWHYRSRDETLIAFSNERYYAGRLSSLPAPGGEVDAEGRPSTGLSLVRVAGEFVRTGAGKSLRTNPVEAAAIVGEIQRRFLASPDDLPSIGVVTFNAQQRTLIESLLRDLGDDRIISALERTDGHGLFVKNLENVQGDERDVVLFSVAFSKDARGVLPLNFGPLNNMGGERRLNVAVTRARAQVMVFCSFDPSDLRAEATQNQGIKDLRRYLELAEKGPSSLETVASRAVVDRHRDDLAQACRQRGLIVTEDVGLSDFKIDLALAHASAPDQPLVAVLLDGELWSRRRTVGDRDGLPVAVLRGLMGWRSVLRVWLPEWLEDSVSVIDRLDREVYEAHSRQPLPTERPPEHEVPPVAPKPSSVDSSVVRAASARSEGNSLGALPGALSWHRSEPRASGDVSWLDNLNVPRARERVWDVMTSFVDAEGPISMERLCRLTAASFGLNRVVASRVKAISALVPRALCDEHGFVWPAGVDRDAYAVFRTSSAEDPRPVKEIHPVELVNAMVAVCRDTWGTHEDDLLTDTLALFGWKRRTSAALGPLRSALAQAEQGGRIVRSQDGTLRAAD